MAIGVLPFSSNMRDWGQAPSVEFEPSEAMVDAAFNAKPLPPMRANREHYRAALKEAFRVMQEETAR